MGAVKDAFEVVYRDFVTAGVTQSGRHEPTKLEIRGLAHVIEQTLVAGGFDTIFETTAAGIAGTTDGSLFLVKGEGASFADLYKHVGGSAMAQDVSLPSTALIETQGAMITEAKERIDLIGRNGAIYAYGAPYIDGAILRWPGFFQRVTGGGYAERAPATSQRWYEAAVPIEAFQGNALVYYDSADNSIKITTVFSPLPEGVGTDSKPTLAQISLGALNSAIAPAQLLTNDFDANMTGRPDLIGDASEIIVTSGVSELASLGINIAYKGSGAKIDVGGIFVRPDARYAFARAFVYDADEMPGAPIVPGFDMVIDTHLSDPSTGEISRGAGVLEKIYSSRLRSYLIGTKVIPDGGMVGLKASLTRGGRNVYLAGIQFSTSDDPSAVVPLAELDASPVRGGVGKMYFPSEIAIFDDRDITLYPTNFLDRRPIAAEYISLSRRVESTLPPVAAGGTHQIEIAASRLVNNDQVRLTRHFDWPLRDQVQFRDLVVRKVAAADLAGKTINALFLGDSKIDDVVTPSGVKARLTGKGATVNLLGTIFGFDGPTSMIYHEGRSGRGLADYLGKDRSEIAYVANPADYIAASNYPGKYQLNPMLSLGSGPGSFDGYRFDFADYLVKYASIIGGTPNIVVIDLPTNDLHEWTDLAAFTDFVDVGFTRIITSVRETGAKVLFIPAAYGWNDYWFALWTRSGPAFWRGLMRAVQRFNDPLTVRISTAFAQMSPFAFGQMAATTVDPDTGLSFGGMADWTHAKVEARKQDIDAISADIAAMMR